jgi:hypothetical protein
VLDVDAGGRVAVMAHVHPVWNRPVGPHPCPPVGQMATLGDRVVDGDVATGDVGSFGDLAGGVHRPSYHTVWFVEFAGAKMRYAHRRVSGVALFVVHGVSK